jgi:hypothetical protein
MKFCLYDTLQNHIDCAVLRDVEKEKNPGLRLDAYPESSRSAYRNWIAGNDK